MWLRHDQSCWVPLSMPGCLSARISGLDSVGIGSLNFTQVSEGNTVYTEDPYSDVAKQTQQLPEDKGCLQSCLPCSLPDYREFPAHGFLILVLKHMTLSVILLKFILFLVFLTRSNKAFSMISWSFPVLAMPSSVESSGHFLTIYSYFCHGLRLTLAKTECG